MKHLPNFITLSRIVLSIAMLPIHTISKAYFVIYTYCGVSDVLDGFLARKLRLSTKSGAKLDSIADIVFYAVVVFKITPSLWDLLTPLVWGVIGVVLILKITSYVIGWIKYHQFASLHTYMNKLTGLLIFAIPYILTQQFALAYCVIISVVATLAALEEVIIHISANEYCADRKTLFVKR